jgi:hypothetical protein
MSKREIAGLACKTLGLYIIVQGIYVIANAISSYFVYQFESGMLVSAVFPFVFLVVFGICVWTFSEKLSFLMVNGEADSEDRSSITANELQRIAFSVLGLFFIGTSLPKLISHLSTMNEMMDAIPNPLTGVFGDITQLVIGLWIFLGSRSLVNLLVHLRHAGLRKEEDWEKE